MFCEEPQVAPVYSNVYASGLPLVSQTLSPVISGPPQSVPTGSTTLTIISGSNPPQLDSSASIVPPEGGSNTVTSTISSSVHPLSSTTVTV